MTYLLSRYVGAPLLAAVLFMLVACDAAPTKMSEAKAKALAQAEILENARFGFLGSMRAWHMARSDGLGSLLYTLRVEGPMNIKFDDMYRNGVTRVPENWTLECLKCASPVQCEADVTVKFDIDAAPSLRRYELQKAGFFGLYQEHILEDSSALRQTWAACKIDNEQAHTLVEIAMERFFPSVDSGHLAKTVTRIFNREFKAYRDEDWEHLPNLLAEFPRRAYLVQREVPNSPERLVQSGELPVKWKLGCAALRVNGTYGFYARFTQRQSPKTWKPFHIVFVATHLRPPPDNWDMGSILHLTEDQYQQELATCQQKTKDRPRKS